MSRNLAIMVTLALTVSLSLAKILPYEMDDMPSASSKELADTNMKVSES